MTRKAKWNHINPTYVSYWKQRRSRIEVVCIEPKTIYVERSPIQKCTFCITMSSIVREISVAYWAVHEMNNPCLLRCFYQVECNVLFLYHEPRERITSDKPLRAPKTVYVNAHQIIHDLVQSCRSKYCAHITRHNDFTICL